MGGSVYLSRNWITRICHEVVRAADNQEYQEGPTDGNGLDCSRKRAVVGVNKHNAL